MNRTSRLAVVVLGAAGAAVLLGGVAHAADPSCTSGSSLNTQCVTPGPTPNVPPQVLGETFTKDGGGAVAATVSSDGLPFTGANVIPLALGGGVLLVGGAGLVTAGSRRRRAE